MKKLIIITIVAVLIFSCVLVGCEDKTGDLVTTDLSVVIDRIGKDALYAPESCLTYNLPDYYRLLIGGGTRYNYEVKLEDFDFYIETISVDSNEFVHTDDNYEHYFEWGDIKIEYFRYKYFTERQNMDSEYVNKTYEYTEVKFSFVESIEEHSTNIYKIKCKYEDENDEKREDLKRVFLDYLSTFKRGSELL